MRWLKTSGCPGGIVAASAVLLLAGGELTRRAQAAPSEGDLIIKHLDAATSWYMRLASISESAGRPSDAIYLENARTLAKQALQLAFQSAEAQAPLLSTGKPDEAARTGSTPSPEATDEQENLSRAVANAAARISQTQARIETLNSQISKARGKKRQELISQRDNLRSVLDLDKAAQEAVQKLLSFLTTVSKNQGGLRGAIGKLEKSVPDLFSKTPARETTPTSPANTQTDTSGTTGLIGQLSLLYSRIDNLREVRRLIEGTARVSEIARQLQSSLRAQLRGTMQRARALANQQVAQDPAQMEADRQNLASLTAQFKQISGATMPLSQEVILLDECQANLRSWESSVHRGYIRILTALLMRVVAILIGLGVVLGLSELWRRAAFRYVREARRRHQLLLVRRFFTTLLMAIVLILGFVSQFSSLLTFAGFLTAGIAVALQTVILSVAAYFFLIGRYGVRVGDRITVSGVTGDVIDVGLLRFYMMELAGTGVDLFSTGRLVVVANSVLFQGVPFFKQIPGTAYAWHELAVTLERGSDYALAEAKLLEAVNTVYSHYRDRIERQHEAIEDLMATHTPAPSPQAHLQLVENGLDLLVRYPVEIHREAEIDNQMIRKLMEAVKSVPELMTAAGSPRIRSAIRA